MSQKGVELERTIEEKKDLERKILSKDHLLTEADNDKANANSHRVLKQHNRTTGTYKCV